MSDVRAWMRENPSYISLCKFTYIRTRMGDILLARLLRRRESWGLSL